MATQFLRNEVLPFATMLIVETCEMSIVILGKAAMNAGLNSTVYVVYYNSLGTLLLLPYFVFYRRSRTHALPISFSILHRCFILGLLGICLLQILAYIGINYSSPTLAAGIGNLMPGFTFILAVIFRMERLNLREITSQAKSLGTVVAITGAMVMTLYQGPTLFGSTDSESTQPNLESTQQSLLSQNSNWVLGGSLITLTCLMSSGWNILQTATLKEYPEQPTVVFFFCCFGTIQCMIYSAIAERSVDDWLPLPSIAIIAIVFSAVCGTVFRTNVLTWCLDKKGPLYVAMFKPVGVIIAAIMEIMFLGASLHLGSVIGAIISSAGFYTVLWGQSKENATLKLDDNATLKLDDSECGAKSSSNRAPLLQ
nr:WAT1-related protein At5g40240-like isoform X1 [Ipomoea batatas]